MLQTNQHSKMISISYAIPACNEQWTLKSLLETLVGIIDPVDQIVVQLDQDSFTPQVEQVALQFAQQYREAYSSKGYPTFKVVYHSLSNNFAQFKNNLKDNCDCDWIFQIDADELPALSMVQAVKSLIDSNTEIELYHVPRVNTVSGITLNHLHQWGWNVTKIESTDITTTEMRENLSVDQVSLLRHFRLIIDETEHELTYYEPVINWPDYQSRLLKNDKAIHWVNPVHEVVKGHKSFAFLPQDIRWSLIHSKDIERQEKQNQFYENINIK